MQKVTSFEEAFANYKANKPIIKLPPRPFGALMRNATIATLMRGDQDELERHQDSLAKEAILNDTAERVARENKFPASIVRKLAHTKHNVDVSSVMLQANRQKTKELEISKNKETQKAATQKAQQQRNKEAAEQAEATTYNIYSSSSELDDVVTEPPMSGDSPMQKRQKRTKRKATATPVSEPDAEALNPPDALRQRNKGNKASSRKRAAEAALRMHISPENQYVKGTEAQYNFLYKSNGTDMPADFVPAGGFFVDPNEAKSSPKRKNLKYKRRAVSLPPQSK